MDALVKIYETYRHSEAIADKRVANWFLIPTPTLTIALSLLYILFSWKIGPWIMLNRAPYSLRKSLVVYNMATSFLNLYIFLELLLGMIDAGYSWPCQPVVMDDDPKQMRIAAAIWWYYASKLIEFLDTVFFVLRKKNSQITFLHVYHHSTMPMLWWIGTKWVPGGLSAHAAILNAFIHIIMYGYYGLSALGPKYQKYLWWKKYLTQMQLIQFCIALTQACITLYMGCDFPDWMEWALIAYMVSFLFLFGNFYLHAYVKGRRQPRVKRVEDAAVNDELVKNGKPKNKSCQESPRNGFLKKYN